MSDATEEISPVSPHVSTDPERRANQLANLPNLRGEPTAGSFKAGATARLSHGLYADRRTLAKDSRVAEIEAELEASLPVQAEGGGAPAVDQRQLWLTACAVLRVERCWSYLTALDEKGEMPPASFDDALRRAEEHAAKQLDRLGMNPRSRAALGLDLARAITAGDAVAAHVERRYGGGPS